jgi:uncharacterized protein YdeI (YjbR/CyaY-like superfamily)
MLSSLCQFLCTHQRRRWPVPQCHRRPLSCAGLQPVSQQDVIDAALCHGWIDGQGLSYDESSYLVRLTPRTPRSLWSQVNRERVMALTQQGRMKERGLEVVAAAKADGRWEAAYSSAKNARMPADLSAALDAHPEAKERYSALSKSAQYQILRGLETVKKAETRARRIAAFVQQPR